MFADDSGLYDSFQPNQEADDDVVQNFGRCCRELNGWMAANILCGSKTQQFKISVNSICADESEISLCSIVREPGLFTDSNITLHNHVNVVVRIYYLSKATSMLWKNCNHTTTSTASISVAVALVLVMLNYCNSCLYKGCQIGNCTIFQVVQNMAARLVT